MSGDTHWAGTSERARFAPTSGGNGVHMRVSNTYDRRVEPRIPPLQPGAPIPDDPGPLFPDNPDDLPPAPHEPQPYTEPAPTTPEPEPEPV
jgi:hypothetical protein